MRFSVRWRSGDKEGTGCKLVRLFVKVPECYGLGNLQVYCTFHAADLKFLRSAVYVRLQFLPLEEGHNTTRDNKAQEKLGPTDKKGLSPVQSIVLGTVRHCRMQKSIHPALCGA